MLIELLEPLAKPGVLRFTYNGQEWYKGDFPAGEPVRISFGPPKHSGVANAFLAVAGEEEVLVGSASYIYQDRLGARMMLDSARDEKNINRARALIRNAIALLEKLDPNSEDVANAYTAMCFSLFFTKSRKHIAKRKIEALSFYEKALAVWEHNGNTDKLAGNLTNVSVMYSRLGDDKTAVARALRGLKLTRAQSAEAIANDKEAVNAWTHAASRCLSAGKIDQANRIVKDGLKRFGEDSPKCAHLWNVRAQVFATRSALCRSKAEQLLPPGGCSI
ncbi:MAG: tetratricopeptide repeat protein [Candidatus Melainabacteria bacterium]|nr:tetratricopeptide repeat protein [Candidatus Melainabacteria bacterium]